MKRLHVFTLTELLVVIAIIGLLAALFVTSLSRATSFAKAAACKSNLHQQGLALAMYVSDFHQYPLSGDARTGQEVIPSGQQLVSLSSWVKLLKPGVRPAGTKAFLCPEPQRVRMSSNIVFTANNASLDEVTVQGPYGYNAHGTATSLPSLKLGLGLEWVPGIPENSLAVTESMVRYPVSMVAIGDSAGLSGFLSPAPDRRNPRGTLERLPGQRHGGNAIVVFADGHIESMPFREWIRPLDSQRRLWNNDNEPHPETW